MQALLDLAPLAAFLVAYRIGGIYTATATLMIAMVLLLLVDWLRLKRIPPMHLMSAVLVIVLGSATLILRDPRFLKWKPTVFMWLVALAALASLWIGRVPLPQRLLAPMIPNGDSLPRPLWQRATWAWVVFHLLLGAANLWVAYDASERTWVYFKVGGLTIAYALFAMALALWLSARAAPLQTDSP